MRDEVTQNLVNDKLQQILDRLGVVESRLTGIDTRLQSIEAKAYDTKPIWERALAELLEVSRRLDSLDRRFSVLNDDVLHTRADSAQTGRADRRPRTNPILVWTKILN